MIPNLDEYFFFRWVVQPPTRICFFEHIYNSAVISLVLQGVTVAKDPTSSWDLATSCSPYRATLTGLIENGGLRPDIAQNDLDGISV